MLIATPVGFTPPCNRGAGVVPVTRNKLDTRIQSIYVRLVKLMREMIHYAIYTTVLMHVLPRLLFSSP